MKTRVTAEELLEHSNNIIAKVEDIYARIDAMEKAMDTLSSWKSDNKELFFDELRVKIRDLKAMAEAANTYGNIGKDHANRVLGTEDAIKTDLLQKNDNIELKIS